MPRIISMEHREHGLGYAYLEGYRCFDAVNCEGCHADGKCVSVLGYVAFFVTICYHTIYAVPWIFPPLAFLGFDYFMRMVRYRIKDATLLPVDKNMTLVRFLSCVTYFLSYLLTTIPI